MLLNILLSMRHKEDDLLQRCFARWGVPAARVGDFACGTGRGLCLRHGRGIMPAARLGNFACGNF